MRIHAREVHVVGVLTVLPEIDDFIRSAFVFFIPRDSHVADDGDPAHQYTAKILSSQGKQDGLYWQVPEGQPISPLGKMEDFVKDALSSSADSPVIDGYSFRILTAQGGKAKGGAKDYLANGKLTGGFAVIATPVKYHDSGIMTFIINREGVVYQKELGQNT